MTPSSEQESADYVSLFLERNGLSEHSTIADVFHAVRRVPYGSRGGRSAEEVVQFGEGSCSGKHSLLRDLLRRLSQKAAVETVRGDFTSRVPSCKSMPIELKQMCLEGGVTDFHQYVVWESPDGELKLDATWSDGPIRQGVPGNMNWAGKGDTALALEPEAVLKRAEDVPAYKEKLLAELSPEVRQRRLTFLALLTNWTAGTETGGDTL
ncbi:hypothetical protein [Pelagibius sp. Alg239-R121]|uniref:hypothetical protein n=1 Tax=Pelagibius sp. Alg239-R121 TaxID=2993448 RepID=UPI0024A6A5D3|nr:hypothetical protein [Pelagibius sp. Alg239-R121]